ncbi:EAL domain-containing protein [Alteromonas sp.]|nr:EAL domain-containing protein [Alteromonas sp.]
MDSTEQLKLDLAKAYTKITELEENAACNTLFSNIFHCSPIPFAVSDVHNNIIHANNAFVDICGYELSETPTFDEWWKKVIPNEHYRDPIVNSWQKCLISLRETNARFEPIPLRIRCKNGTKRTLFGNAVLLQGGGADALLTILYDTPDHGHADSQIRASSNIIDDLTHSLAALQQELIDEKQKASENTERLSLAMKGANDGLWDWDIANEKMYYSPRWKSMLGYQENELTNEFATWERLVHPDDLSPAVSRIQSFMESKTKHYEAEFRMRHKNGSYVNILSRAFVVESEEGEITRLVGTHVDITARKKSEEKLSYQSSHDSLTGLANRREFKRRVELLLSVPAENRVNHALCYMDLDQFKVVNDTCGHLAGDELLRQLGFLLQKVVRQTDAVARLGGDEFAVLLENCSFDKAHQITSLIQKEIEDYRFIWEGRSFRIGVSMGLIQISDKYVDFTEVLKLADVACYIAKEKGRNRIHVHYDDDKELAERQGEMQWVNKVQDAIDENRFKIYAQLIEPLSSNDALHYELLLRMVDVKGELIPPGAFLPPAERYQLIVKVDSWMIENAFTLIRNNPDFLENINFLSINLSGQSLTNDDFLAFITEKLNVLGEQCTKICFEITETAAISNLEQASAFIDGLKVLGCRFALDDFGSGLSSFGYLKNLKVDYLKIDGIFVKDIASDPIDLAMVKAINEIGHVTGMKTIAEFVETKEIRQILSSMGVDYAQGYAVHKPQPIEELL